jgi:hypothetical protein
MALVGNISGSGGTSNTVGITGSLIIANPGLGTFPGLGGNDVALFVSGNISAKPSTSPDYSIRGTTVFGGDVVISGTLFGGSPLFIGSPISASAGFNIPAGSSFVADGGLTGSIQQTAGGLSYLVAGANVTIASASNGQITISSTGGGGGGGAGVFTEASGIAAFTTSSIAIGIAAAASTRGSDVFFFVSGSTNGTANALFGGDVVTSGSLTVRDGTASLTIADNTFGNSVITANVGHLILDATGINRVIVDKDLELSADNLYAGGSGGLRNLFPDNVIPAHAIVIGGAGSKTVTSGTLQVIGNEISGSEGGNIVLGSAGSVAVVGGLTAGGGYGDTGVTLSGAGNVRANGFLQVDGEAYLTGSVTLAGNSQAVTHTGTGNLSISSTTGNVLVEGTVFVGNNVTIPGDLTVNGTVVAIDTTNLRIKDPIVLIGSGSAAADSKSVIAFASGSSGGINSLVFGAAGVAGGNFLAAAQADVQDGSLAIGSLSLTNYVPIRASSFQLGGTLAVPLAFVSSSVGTDLILSGTTANLGSTIFNFQRADSTFATFGGNGPGTGATLAGATGRFLTVGAINGTLNLSGSTVTANFSSAFQFQEDGVSVIEVTAPTTTTPRVAAAVSNATLTVGTSGASSSVIVSGSTAVLQTTAANGVYFRADATNMLRILSPSSNTINIDAQTGFTTANVVNTVATTVNLAGAATTVEIGAATGTTSINNDLAVDGNTTLGNATTDTVTFTARAASHLLPTTDSTYDLGSPTLRWRNMYTGDLHLRNDRGSWTIIEEADYLSITNNLDGRRYKFVLKEI